MRIFDQFKEEHYACPHCGSMHFTQSLVVFLDANTQKVAEQLRGYAFTCTQCSWRVPFDNK